MDLEREYLKVRYNCEALRIVSRRYGKKDLSDSLKEPIRDLCTELRLLLNKMGRSAVSYKFPSKLLNVPLDKLVKECYESARMLSKKSSAADTIVRILDSYG